MSQPMHRLFNRARLDDRQVNELLGLSHGIIADGIVSAEEAQYLQKWLVANTAVKDNRGDHDEVPAEFMKWVWAGGRKLKGL